MLLTFCFHGVDAEGGRGELKVVRVGVGGAGGWVGEMEGVGEGVAFSFSSRSVLLTSRLWVCNQ